MCFQGENVSDIGSFRLSKKEFRKNGSKATIIYSRGSILRVSNQFESLFGYDANEMIGKPLLKIITPMRMTVSLGLVTMTTGKPIFTVIHHQNGKRIPGVLTYRETRFLGGPYKVIQIKKLLRRGEKSEEIVQVS